MKPKFEKTSMKRNNEQPLHFIKKPSQLIRLGSVSTETNGDFGPWEEGNGVWIKW